MNFKHFIITHFNVKFHWAKKGRNPSTGKAPDKAWLEHRIKLFDKFCFPSVINQTNKNFKWLIFFDDESTDKQLFENYTQCTKVYLKDYKVFSYKLVSKEIKKLLNKGTKWILTTRLDNDDSLSKHYIDTIQKRFVEKNMILNPSLGIVYDIHKKVGRRLNYMCPNSFLTAVEKVTGGELKTCFRVNHPQLRNHFKTFSQIQTKFPLWLQIIHKRNLGNTMRGKVLKDPSKLLKDFNIK